MNLEEKWKDLTYDDDVLPEPINDIAHSAIATEKKMKLMKSTFIITIVLDADNIPSADKTHTEVLEAYNNGFKIIAHIKQNTEPYLIADVDLSTYDASNNIFAFSVSWENLVHNLAYTPDDNLEYFVTELVDKNGSVSNAYKADFAEEAGRSYYADESKKAENADYSAEAYHSEYAKESEYSERAYVSEHADKYMLTGNPFTTDFLGNFESIHNNKSDTSLMYSYDDENGFVKFLDLKTDDNKNQIITEVPVHVATDDTPTKDSEKPITSGGVYNAIGHWVEICKTDATTEEVVEVGITSDTYPVLSKCIKIMAECNIPKGAENSNGYWKLNDINTAYLSSVVRSDYQGTSTIYAERQYNYIWRCECTIGGNNSGQQKPVITVPYIKSYGENINTLSLRSGSNIVFPIGTQMNVWGYIVE